MPELPSGTVTFLFTDIEGSTRLIEQLGEDGYVQVLADHRRLLRGALSARGGVEVDTQGDALLYVFPDAGEALAAAAEAQRALASGPVRVRMGLHTGEPRPTGEGYAGRELHRAARIAACGQGGHASAAPCGSRFLSENRRRSSSASWDRPRSPWNAVRWLAPPRLLGAADALGEEIDSPSQGCATSASGSRPPSGTMPHWSQSNRKDER